MTQRRGFTLIELIVVLAVIGILAAILAPVIGRYIDDARKSTAAKDTKALAAAITMFFKDVGTYPGWVSGGLTGGNNSAFTILMSSDTADVPSTGADGSTTGNWNKNNASVTEDTMANHIQKNTPGTIATANFRTTGRFAWQGPYQHEFKEDPWGTYYAFNSKLITDANKTQALVVISAGPDREMDTVFSQVSKDFLTTDDDIVVQIR